jgi:regulatory protein
MPRGRRPRETPPADPVRLTALRLVGRRDLTRVELASRLADRGYPPEAIDAAVAELIRMGAVDDRRTAFAHVRTASRIKGRGRLRIRRELEARGIDSRLIHEALDQVSADEDRQAITRFLARKSSARDTTPNGRRRLFQQLLRRGFPADLIAKTLKGAPDD